ncbi:hypothetical protein B808_1015 [Fructilactobacillus florum 8D]|uniref:Uncharacterized protein n=2 Tax=Fructilactobacillus florum TaxID=640331 RepID=W9EDB9_9LACO|nr:hypothetical protein [Fructilactobacillus florum]EKK20093.1 hypothetical protein B807_1165 [Fructilactobacillus florum 2F]ETO40067.1 hypothetical protein B808_1015 [Fructilactobacillus florum 8D]KRM91145.1 hypothetical protein FC87_GL001071 [Fructilactobacillus florum DSM 22689 = JCM 16035]
MVLTKADFTKRLDELRTGELDSLTVTPDQFFYFQQAFMDYETRKRIVGEAATDGVVVYHYATDN